MVPKKKKPEIESLYRNPELYTENTRKTRYIELGKSPRNPNRASKMEEKKKLTQKNRAKPEERRGDQDGRETVAA